MKSLMFLLTILLLSCSTTSISNEYPSKWWEPFPREEAYSWEILPQDAGDGEVILSKRNELGLLSNFAATPFIFEGKRYASLEGFWQMMKYPEDENDPRMNHPGANWEFTREEVAQMTSFDAKRAGSKASKIMKKMNINWVTYKGRKMTYRTTKKGKHYMLIVDATWAKVNQNSNVKDLLLRTGDLILKPDHKQKPNSPPAWKYFQIYMDIRAELQR